MLINTCVTVFNSSLRIVRIERTDKMPLAYLRCHYGHLGCVAGRREDVHGTNFGRIGVGCTIDTGYTGDSLVDMQPTFLAVPMPYY